jgi:hypothetical protein
MLDYCLEPEINWVKNFHSNRKAGLPGLLLNGLDKPDTRCQAICAALLRNYIDARVVTFNALIEMYGSSGEALSTTVILIPNLFDLVGARSIPPWKAQMMYDLLLARTANRKPTVAYIESTSGIATAFGKPFANFLEGFTTAE